MTWGGSSGVHSPGTSGLCPRPSERVYKALCDARCACHLLMRRPSARARELRRARGLFGFWGDWLLAVVGRKVDREGTGRCRPC